MAHPAHGRNPLGPTLNLSDVTDHTERLGVERLEVYPARTSDPQP